jgi:FKBP-type peptidyl-prolyl cis-trans isomerase
MQSTVLKSFTVLLLSLFILSSCDTTDPFSFPPPDFSTVPEPFDFSNAESVVVEEGIETYTLEEGSGQFTVTQRDQVTMFITLRTMEGEIIFSTFNDSRTDPVTVTVGTIEIDPRVFQYSVALSYTEGLRKGLVGMKQGEQRTIVVSPEKGFRGLPSSSANGRFRESTLQYDILVTRISN